jgi:hypothetical protein
MVSRCNRVGNRIDIVVAAHCDYRQNGVTGLNGLEDLHTFYSVNPEVKHHDMWPLLLDELNEVGIAVLQGIDFEVFQFKCECEHL